MVAEEVGSAAFEDVLGLAEGGCGGELIVAACPDAFNDEADEAVLLCEDGDDALAVLIFQAF